MTRRNVLSRSRGFGTGRYFSVGRSEDGDGRRLGFVLLSFRPRPADGRGQAAAGNAELHRILPLSPGREAYKSDCPRRRAGYTGKVRRTCEEAGMYFEASAGLPRSDSDIDQFRDLLKAAENAGAKVVRTVLFSGRRYEEHDSMETYREAKRRAWEMVTRAEPHLRKRRMKIAIENHKNLRTPDLLDMMDRIQSEYVGITFDFGNNYVLMEDPVEMAQALGKYAYASHIKDHILQAYEDGLLLYDAVLGDGVIDLPKVIRLLRQGNPDIKFTLETMTRDALKVPYLTERYWATFEPGEMPARDLAMTLRTIRDTQPKEPLPLFSKLSEEEKLKVEDENVRKGLAYAADNLGL